MQPNPDALLNDTNNPNPGENGSGSSGAGQQATTPPPDTVDWKAKHDGLHGHALNLKKERDEWFNKYNELNRKLAALELETESKLGDATRQATEAASKAQEWETKATKFEREAALRSTIRQKHPSLLGDFEDGLLRLDGLEGDALDSYLEKYSSRMSTVQDDAIRGSLKGAKPPAPSGGSSAAKSPDELYEEVMRSEPGSDAYRNAWEAYKNALRNK